MISYEYILLGAAALLLLSITASKASSQLGVPAILLFLVLGMLAGSEGLGGIYFDNYWLAQSLGVTALAFILFSGGLDTNWLKVRPVLGEGLRLSSLGVLLTTLLIGLFAQRVLGFSLYEGLLLGAIVSSTDAAAVFSILRSRNMGLRGPLTPLLELESGSNDPMAVFLTLGIIRLLVDPNASALDLVSLFLQQMAIGATIGYMMGKVAVWVINSLRLEYEGLYPVLTLTMVLLTYGLTATVGGSGFLAVYLAGLVIGNSDFIHKRSLMQFHDGLAWLMQIAMFVTMGLLVFPSALLPVAGTGFVLSLFLMLVARPVSVFMALSFTKMNVKEKVMTSWVGLRGAAPIVLATFPLLAGVPQAEAFFNMVFFIVLTSVLLQGTSVAQVAKWLGVDAPLLIQPRYSLECIPADRLTSDLVEIKVPANSGAVGRQIVELGLPVRALIVLIRREHEFIIPNGGTIIKAHDVLRVLGEQEAIAQMHSLLGGKPGQTSKTGGQSPPAQVINSA